MLVCWPRTIRNAARSSDKTTRTPKWSSRICVCRISSSVKRWEPAWSRRVVVLCWDRKASLPPRRISPSSKKGFYLAILELLGKAEFLWGESSSGAKISLCTTRTQYMRVASIFVPVSSPGDFFLLRKFIRNQLTQAVVRISRCSGSRWLTLRVS